MGSLSEWINPPLIWFVVGLVFVLLEFVNPGVVMIFFGIGAWIVALILLFIGISLNLQLSVFLVVSILLLWSLRRHFKTLFQSSSGSTNEEETTFSEFFGKKAVVTQTIKPEIHGKVEFRGTYWNAESSETIAEGEPVEIIDKNNITLIVKPA